MDTFEYSSPSRGERERRYQKRRRRRRCGSRREEWVSLFDRNLAAKGEDEEEDTKISRKKWRGEKKTGGGERRARERAGEREREREREEKEGRSERKREKKHFRMRLRLFLVGRPISSYFYNGRRHRRHCGRVPPLYSSRSEPQWWPLHARSDQSK